MFKTFFSNKCLSLLTTTCLEQVAIQRLRNELPMSSGLLLPSTLNRGWGKDRRILKISITQKQYYLEL